MKAIEKIELYNLKDDVGETTDVASKYPDVVQKIKSLANDMRNELGDNLLNIQGIANRPIGRID
jgi:hypothetical protein